MKRFLFITIVLFIFHSIEAQVYFNNRYQVVDYISGDGVLLVDNDTLISLINGTDIDPYNYYGLGFARYDLKGNLLNTHFTKPDSPKLWQIWPNNNAFLVGNKIYTVINTTDWKALFVEVDKYTGEIINRIVLKNEVNGELQYYYAGNSIEQLDENKYIVLGGIWEEDDRYLDAMISIVDLNLDTIIHRKFGIENQKENYRCLLVQDDGFIVGGRLTDDNIKDKDYILQESIAKLDFEGNEIWRYTSSEDQSRGQIWDMLMEEDGSIIYTGELERQEYDSWTGFTEVNGRPTIGKLGPDHQPLWLTPIGLDTYFWHNSFVRILRSPEGDGYILGGDCSTGDWNEPVDVEGNMLKNGEPWMLVGVLAKVSPEGDSLWTRTYHYVSKYEGKNTINDLDHSPDGGYILLGETTKQKGEVAFPIFYSWLVKVDEYGCLIPGCEDTTSVSDYSLEALPVMVYPNPASDHLYIYQREKKALDFEIFDLQGRMMDRFSGSRGQETHIVSLMDYPSGSYMLRVRSREGRIATKRFVKK